MSARRLTRARVGRARCVTLFLLGALALGACSPRVDARFARAADAAGALYVAGRYHEAGEGWLAAAGAASSPVDRDEANYRAATSFGRAGETARAEALLVTLAQGHGERAARASFDRARLVSATDAARGDALRLEALRRHPSSGVAGQALREYLGGLEDRSGSPAALERCRALRVELSATELDEALRYECARRAEAEGELERARDDYLATAARHPYPGGAYWDDSLVGAARCEERLGHATRAVELLEQLLAEREHSVGLGSYERSAYAEARFHIAELYRDTLHDTARARREFRRVFDEHPTSRLRDDALFEEACLAEQERDPKGACEPVLLLTRDLPDSRFSGCADLLCAGAARSAKPCPSIARERILAGAR